MNVSPPWYENTGDGQVVERFFRALRPEAKSLKAALELLNRDHYVKEVFLDSDTVMAIISGVPTATWEKNPLPPDQMPQKVKDLLTNRVDKMCFMRADSRARYEKVVEVVDNLRAAGVDQLGLLTEQIQERQTPGTPGAAGAGGQ